MAKVRKTTTALLDKSGAIIYKSEWEARRADQDYWLLHKTESKSGHVVTAEWSGKIENAHRTPKSRWAPWALEVSFISRFDENGAELDEPITSRDELACEQFITLEELEAAYNKFITRYCGVTTHVTLTKGRDDPAPPPPRLEEPSFEDDDDGDKHDDDDYGSNEDELVEPDVSTLPANEDADKVSGGMGGDW